MTEPTQAPVDATKAEATPSAPVNDAGNKGDDLDALLSEYQTATTTPLASPPQTEAAAPQAQPTISEDRVRAIEERFFQEDLQKTVSNVLGEIDLSERAKKGWVDQLARDYPSFGLAFANRYRNPEAWNTAQEWAGRQAKKEFASAIDKNVTEDTMAVAAAVRGASTKAPAEQPENFSRMSTNDFRKSVIEKYGFDPAV